MTPELITFDSAQTLVDVRWSVASFIRQCSVGVGLILPESAFAPYMRLYAERIPEFLEINLTRDVSLGRAWWERLTRDWLAEIQEPEGLTERLVSFSDELVYSPHSELFRLFEDVTPCLDRLSTAGYRLAVISNWDYSLHRILKTLGIYERFELVLASLEEGVEKPDARLFNICLERLGIEPSKVIHVGDNPVDDAEGAANAGIGCILIDRTGEIEEPHIRSLDELEDAFAWID